MDQGESATTNLDWEKALTKFQNVMATGTKPLKMKAMVKLARFSKHAPEHILSRTIPVLIEILDQNIPNDPAPSLQEAAVYCLKCIACRGDGRLAIQMCRQGTTNYLIRLLPQYSEGKMQKVLIKWLLVLVSFCKASRLLVFFSGGLGVIIDLLKSPHTNIDIRRYLLEILSALSLLMSARKELITVGALHLIVEAAGIGSMISRERACRSIGLLGYTREVGRKLIELGAVPVLAKLLHDGNETIKLEAANSLGILSVHVDHDTRIFVQAGVIPLCAELLQGPNPSGKEIAEDVLYILAETGDCNVEIVEHLVRILRDGDDEAKAAAADVMWKVSEYKVSTTLFQDFGAIPILVELLGSGNEDVLENVCGTIGQLSYGGEDRVGLAEAGAIPMLMDLLHHPNEDVRDNAVETVNNFYGDPLYHDKVSNAINVPSFRDVRTELILSLASNEDMITRAVNMDHDHV